MKIKISNKKSSLSIELKEIILFLVIIDLLFFPYIRIFHCSVGMIIVLLWSLFNVRKINKISIISSVIIFLSMLYGIIFFEAGKIGIESSIILVYSLVLYDFFNYHIRENMTMKNVFILYILFVLCMVAVYMLMPNKYFNIRSFWSLNVTEITFTELQMSRFTHIFSDPNNAGTILTAIFSYLVVYEKLNLKELFIIILTICLSVIMSFSISASILFIVAIIIILIGNMKFKKINFKTITIAIFIITFIGIILINLDNILNNQYIKTLLLRKQINSSNGLGGRIEIWRYTLASIDPLNYIFLGKGNVIDSMGNIIKPHNGVLYILYSYGLVTLLLLTKKFIKFNYKKLLNNVPLLPILINILINTGFNDYRFMSLSVLLISLMHIKNKKNGGVHEKHMYNN